MRYMRCECGKAEYFDGGVPPQDCQGCDSCGTTYASHPDNHKPRVEHDWKPRFDANTGEPTKRMCKRCYTIEKVAQ